MKEDNGKIKLDKLSATSDCFMKKYKESMRKFEDINIDKNKEKYKLLNNDSKIKFKSQSKTKLPIINNGRNINFSLIQYVNNIEKNKIINKDNNKNICYSPQNNIINKDSYLKKEKLLFYKKKVEPNNNSYSKNLNDFNNKCNNSSNDLFMKKIKNIDTFFEGYSVNAKNNPNSLLGINNDIKLGDSLFKSINIQSIVSPRKISRKKIIKNTNKNKNKSIEDCDIKKSNKSNETIIYNMIKRNEITPVIIKKSKKILRSENENDKRNKSNSNKLYINELKYSKSEKHIFLTKKNIKKNKHNKDKNSSTKNSTNKHYFIVSPGNNGKLIENVILTRPNWEKLPYDKKKENYNLHWTPLASQINYCLHKSFEETHIANHFEFQNEIGNKKNIFINLLKYCELNDINLFSFFPLTIVLPLNNENYNIAIENFKNCYFDLPNLVEDPKKKNDNFLDKYYRNYFHVKSNIKLGCIQKIVIPKSHYAKKNLWLIKRTNLNRGKEIKIFNNLEDILSEINRIKNDHKIKTIIIQKYIEKPLLYCKRKFDIRIWVLFTYVIKTNRFEAYVFKEGHLKASSEIYNINSLDLFIHLTNYSVQKYSKNFSKNEIGNEISFNTFQKELDKKGIDFKKDIFNNIVNIIGITANIARYKINLFNRKNCFEIFGYDFILDEKYNPFLLEINSNPGYEESSPLIKMLVPRMIDDALRLTIDKVFERNDLNKNSSKFTVDDYNNEENMWQKIKL